MSNNIWQKRFRDPAVLDSAERNLLVRIGSGVCTFDAIATASSAGCEEVASQLEQLEVDGWIVSKDGHYKFADDAPAVTVPSQS
jgi:predicted transcriptional regulator